MRKRSIIAILLTLLVTGCSGGSPGGAPAGRPPIPAPADVAAPPADAQRTSSGLATKVISPGTGTRHPRPNSRVTAHYTGWTADGKMFESSVQSGQPLTIGLDEVIPGWTEGIQMMVEGEKRRLWIPQALAYKGAPGSPAGMLVFDVELIRIES
jgi:FKBP-type peptidyl-prolyl cis-trans isomerase